MTYRFAALAAAAIVASAGAASAQDTRPVRIVGSSTVFPFATAVAERFGQQTQFQTPVIESTGSGGGIRLFCAGVGLDHPDITNASRRMEAEELEGCMSNGVEAVTEVVVGYDGIVVANAQEGPVLEVTRADLYNALHAGSEAETWADVNPALPAVAIEVFGPPPTSGTRDAFEELVMEAGCEDAGGMCDEIAIREDGPYIEAGENDNLIVSRLQSNPDAVGVFGYSFLEENSSTIQGASIDGVDPTFDNILSGDYPVARSLFFYIKNAHVGVVPGIQEYAREFVSDGATGQNGYLVDVGLIPLPEGAHEDMKARVENLTPITVEALGG